VRRAAAAWASGRGALAVAVVLTWGRAASAQAAVAADAAGIPTTGIAVPELRSFDEAMLAYMARHRLPGGALAVVKDGRLVLARGYGYADRERKEPVQPTSLFRLASVSKPITAVAILTLVQSGKLDLETKAFPLLGLKPFLKPGAVEDLRINEITVRQLLHHTGGFDRDKSGDPMFQHFQIAREMGIPSPPDHRSLIRWVMGRPLDFDPGSREAYSNFGYCVLGRIIEKVSGRPYEAYVRDAVLRPAGIRRMRIGNGRPEERAPGEVRYYDLASERIRAYDSGARQRLAEVPYAFASPRTLDAHGGWIASAVDVARFAASLDRPRGRPLLSPKSTAHMYERPEPPVGLDKDGRPADVYYACGWLVRPVGSDGAANYWHNGSMPGTFALLVRRHDGLSWAALFNQRVTESGPDDSIDLALHRAAAAVERWPSGDQFGHYP
jgi:N-acyl-D-amino-acid deacylase